VNRSAIAKKGKRGDKTWKLKMIEEKGKEVCSNWGHIRLVASPLGH